LGKKKVSNAHGEGQNNTLTIDNRVHATNSDMRKITAAIPKPQSRANAQNNIIQSPSNHFGKRRQTNLAVELASEKPSLGPQYQTVVNSPKVNK